MRDTDGHTEEPSFARWDPAESQAIGHLPRIDRPREKLMAKGAGALSDVELLAVLLGSGTRKWGVLALASRVLRAVDGRLNEATVEQLEAIPGIGCAKACQITAAVEFVRRQISRGRPCVRSAADVLPYVLRIRHEKQEHFVCLSLNGANEVLAARVVTVGLLDTNQVHPREVFADPIADRAASVIFAHNHPSGTLQASPEDLALTQRLVKAGQLLGIRVLDHLILTEAGYLSLKQEGRI